MFSVMGFGVYREKNMASRKYELEFFQECATALAAQFKDQPRDGVLLGHPLSKDNHTDSSTTRS